MSEEQTQEEKLDGPPQGQELAEESKNKHQEEKQEKRNKEQETRNKEQESRNKEQETRNNEQKTRNKEQAKIRKSNRLVLRDYSKGIFFYPLAIYSFIAAIIEHIGELGDPSKPGENANVLSMIWIVLFFTNVFIVSFDVSVAKFIALLLIGGMVALLVIYLALNSLGSTIPFVLNLEIRTQFYWMILIALGVIMLFTYIASRFRYVKIERNEVLVKGILGDVKRFPTSNLNYEKKIPGVFKYILLGSGSIILHIPGVSESVDLNTVINVQKKAQQLDVILSSIKTTISDRG
jgi:hypothetical protein